MDKEKLINVLEAILFASGKEVEIDFLLEKLKKHSGRNSYGRITVRHRGGGNKQKYSEQRLHFRTIG